MESLLLVLHFNSRPHGGRPFSPLASGKLFFISTHALTEGDYLPPLFQEFPRYFNSRPHGGRRLNHGKRICLQQDISTHALTEGDIHLRSFARKCRISTHALTEGDQNSTESGMHGEDFNSRPHGGRRFYLPSFPPLYDFNSRPHGGRPGREQF